MLGLFLDGCCVIEGAEWVDKVLRVKDPSTTIALVPARVQVVTVRAFAFDETVRKKAFVVEAVELGYLLTVHVPVLLDFEVEVSDELFVDAALGSGVIVEFNLERLEKLDDEFMVLVGKLARRNTQFDGLYFDRGAVLVAPAYHYYVFPLQSEVPSVNVSRQ